MQALAAVEAGDVIGHVELGLCMVRVIALPDTFHVQVQEEALSNSVIPAVALAAHAADEAMFVEQGLVLVARVLAAAVGMDDSPAAGRRAWIAMRRASQTRVAGMLGAIAQPTTLRENRSSTTAK